MCIEPLVVKNENPGRSSSVSFVNNRIAKKRNILYYLKSTSMAPSNRKTIPTIDNTTTKTSSNNL